MAGVRFAVPLAFATLAGCASSLVSREEIDKNIQPPPELAQKIEALDPATLPSPAPTPAPSPVVAPAKESRAKKPARRAQAAAAPAKPMPTTTAPPSPATWSPTHWPYGVGERINWAMRWGVIEGGNITLNVEEPKVLEGVPVLHYRGVIKSSRLLEFVYKIDDEIISWVRLADHLPLRHEIHQNESGRQGKRVVVFDPEGAKAKFFAKARLKDGRVEEHLREDPVTNLAQDIFGAMYFYRFIDRRDGITFPIHDRWRNWANQLTYLGEETIRVPAGEFKTLHYKLLPRVQGFLAPQGDVEVWLRDDPTKVLVRFKAKIKVGSVTGELTDYQPGRPIALPLPRMKTPTDLSELGEAKAR